MLKKLLTLAAALACVCCVTLGAGAEEMDITVQLDGQELTFTDAYPQVKDSRTFLPYRAVFEAMGAEVGYEGNTVTAVRGDTSLTMTIGSTVASVTEDGVTRELVMDVAPYVDSATWRTYVPVRFAADAFGCSVGWDQAAMTAIIVDTETVAGKLLAGKSFTLLEGMTALETKYNTGNWAMSGTMDMGLSLLGSDRLPLVTGDVAGITAGSTQVEAGIDMLLDLSGLMGYVAALEGATLADMGYTEDDLRFPLAMAVCGDVSTGKVYSGLDATTAALLGLEGEVWLSMDMNAMLAEAGMDMDFDQLVAATEQLQMADVVELLVLLFPLDNRAADGYTQLYATLDGVLSALSDGGFTATAGGKLTALELPFEDGSITATLKLTTAGSKVTGYDVSLVLAFPVDAETQAIMQQSGLPMDSVSMTVQVSLDADDHMLSLVQLSAGALLGLDMRVTADYAPTTAVPVTAPPAGAVVVDYMELLYGMMGE